MDYDTYDMRAESIAYRADMVAEEAAVRLEMLEVDRINWAQAHGNDSGFDPYAGIYTNHTTRGATK